MNLRAALMSSADTKESKKNKSRIHRQSHTLRDLECQIKLVWTEPIVDYVQHALFGELENRSYPAPASSAEVCLHAEPETKEEAESANPEPSSSRRVR
jgi:hypothetical protein